MGTPAALTQIDFRVIEDQNGDLFLHVDDLLAWLERYGVQLGEAAKETAERPWRFLMGFIHTETLRVSAEDKAVLTETETNP